MCPLTSLLQQLCILGRELDCRGWPAFGRNSDIMRGNTGLDGSLVWPNMIFLLLFLLSLQARVCMITVQKEQAHGCISYGTKCFLHFLSPTISLQLCWFQLSLISWHLSGTSSPATYNVLDQVSSSLTQLTNWEILAYSLAFLHSPCTERWLRLFPRSLNFPAFLERNVVLEKYVLLILRKFWIEKLCMKIVENDSVGKGHTIWWCG